MSQGRRTAPLPRGWARIRARILDRDGHVCQWIRRDTGEPCHEPARHVDHIKPAAEHGGDEDSNLQALCVYHHGVKTGAEGGRAANAIPPRRRPTELHPGLLR